MQWEKLLKGSSKYDYDDWLEFFRSKVPAGELMDAEPALRDKLPPDGYAALMRWLEIFDHPSRIDKLYKAQLDKLQEEDIMAVAVGDDDEKFYEALIKRNTHQLNSSSVSQQEVARLSQNINIFRKELRDIRSRKPKEGTVLARVLAEAAAGPKKPTAKKTKATAKKADKKPKSTAKSPKKGKTTSVKKKATASKAVGATAKKKTTKTSSKAKK